MILLLSVGVAILWISLFNEYTRKGNEVFIGVTFIDRTIVIKFTDP